MTTVPANLTPPPVTAKLTASPKLLNTLVISTAVEKLFGYVNGNITPDNNNDHTEFGKYCSSLSRGIDYFIGISDIPQRTQELPKLMKQLCRWSNDMSFQAAIMVLMISVKGACKSGWFSEKDNEELHCLSNEIANNFSSAKDLFSGETTFHQTVSSVISRFYPGMKMGGVLAFIEATPGYGAYVKDFHMTENAKASNENVYLFVARTDTTETSSCIVSPQLVNILLNGKPVEKRTCVYTDPGPQLPTDVTDNVRPGTNLLQAVGQFNGKYIILVAFMSVGSNPRGRELPDYVPPAAAASDSDNEITEGPSRISLKCPISFKRINTPVKGHLCNHLPCFDYDNYVDINSRVPSWRCPLCGQSVCFTDIRIDQAMVKVLKEVGEKVSHVKFSGDGSWLTFEECDNHAKKPPVPQEESPTSNSDSNIITVAEDDNDMETNQSKYQIDKKPTRAQLQAATSLGQSQSQIDKKPTPAQLQAILTSSTAMNTVSQAQASASNSMQSPAHTIGTSSTIMNAMSHGQTQTQVSASINMPSPRHTTEPCNTAPPMMAPVTGTVMNATSQSQSLRSAFNDTKIPAHAILTSSTAMNTISHGQSQSQSQSQASASNTMQSPTHTFRTSSMNAMSHGQTQIQGQTQISALNNMQLPTHSTGPSQSYVSSDMQFMRNDHSGRYPIPARHVPLDPTPSTGTQFYNYHTDQHQTMRMMSSPPSQNMGTQNWVHRDVSSQPVQQFSAHSGLPLSYSSNQMRLNSLGQFSPPIHQGIVGPTYGQSSQEVHHQYINVEQPSIPFSNCAPTVPSQLQNSRSSVNMMTSFNGQRGQVVRASEGSVDQNMPAMRGSITSRVYSEAVSQMIILPTEPVQAASQQPVLNSPRPTAVGPHMQVLMARNGSYVHGYPPDGASGPM